MMSFPVPLSPVINIDRFAAATRSSFWRTSRIAAVCPKITDSGGNSLRRDCPFEASSGQRRHIDPCLMTALADALFVKRNCISVANAQYAKIAQ